MIYNIYLPPEYNPYGNVVHPMILEYNGQTYASFLHISGRGDFYSDFATQNIHSFVDKFSQYLKTYEYDIDIHSMRTFLKNLYTTNPQQSQSLWPTLSV